MNCCDANGNCNQGCDCPARKPMKFPFAPGTIEGPNAGSKHGLGEGDAYPLPAAVLLLVLLCAVLGSVVAGFLAGYVTPPGWLIVAMGWLG